MLVRGQLTLLKCVELGFGYRRNLSSLDHMVKRITVNTGADLYPELKKLRPKLYRKIGSGGVSLTVDYLDTKADGKPYSKLIVAVHGVPDTYETFTKLIEHFHNTDVRIIAPNLPDFGHTKRDHFWHSSDEKVAFLRSFLKQIHIDTVDCLVNHSYGVHPNSGLWDKSWNVRVKSVAMFSPTTLVAVDMSQAKYANIVFLFTTDWWYRFLSAIKLHRQVMFNMKHDKIEDFLFLAVNGFDTEAAARMLVRLDQLVEQNIPTALVVGGRDKLISKRAISELNRILKISTDQVIVFDPEKSHLEDVKLCNTRNSILVPSGGHFLHKTNSNLTNKVVEELLAKLH